MNDCLLILLHNKNFVLQCIMKIIFFRHGETIFNIEDKFQGIANSPLTQKGIDQAKAFNHVLLQKYYVKKFYLSPAMRVLQTYELASEQINSEMFLDSRLRECCYGEWEGKTRSELPAELLEKRTKNRLEFTHPGKYQGINGENYLMVFERVQSFLEELLSSSENNNNEEDLCIISHNGVMMGIKKYFEKLSPESLVSLRIKNSSYFVYDCATKVFTQMEIDFQPLHR